MINARELMRLHVQALFTCDGAGRLVSVNERNGAAAPRLFLGRTADGIAWWLRYDLDPALSKELGALCESLPEGLEEDADLTSAAPIIARLSREAPVSRTWAGPAFCFPSELPADDATVAVTLENAPVLSPHLEDWRPDVAPGVPMVVALEGGNAVSVCCSVRMTPEAHEAGVETHPDFRRRGHSARAVVAWARAVRRMEREPLYSTSWQNEPSRALAKRLGLIQYGIDLHIT
jgi:RimJ/RimL family protein N-acetyltransferase